MHALRWWTPLAALLLPLAAGAVGPFELLKIVPAGENAPEAILRVTQVRVLQPGLHQVTTAGGPCRRQSSNEAVVQVETPEKLNVGDLFFKVPLARGSGFALRRATPEEVANYEKCRWR